MRSRDSLPPGVRLLDRIMKASPQASISRMDAAMLAKAQATVIPDRGAATLLLGRSRRSVAITTSGFEASHGAVLPLRIYTPRAGAPGGRPVVVNFHGGGFALGSARQADWICAIVASEVGAVVVSVDYRLAPTHKFPAAVDDCFETLGWVAAHAGSVGGDASRLAVMGDSAGGNLAAVVSLMARDAGGPALLHQALIYPATDLTAGVGETASYQANTRGIVLSNADMAVFNELYLEPGADTRDWRLSPLYAPDHSGLPPATVVVAELDPLHDSGIAYASALRAAGVAVTVRDYLRMPHGFLSFPYLARAARPAMVALVADQRRALS